MKPVTAQEAYDIARTRSDPDIFEKLDDGFEKGRLKLVEEGQKPDLLLGGSWPSRTPGALRASCSLCSAFVGLSPNSGARIHELYPDVPIVCYACMSAN